MSATTVVGAAAPAPARPRPRPAADWPVLLAASFLLLLALAAIAPGLLAGRDPLQIEPRHAFAGPSLHHLFGTDQSGRDIFARVVAGARQSLLIGVGATAIGVGIAVVLGLAGGLGGALGGRLVGGLLATMFSFPALTLALLFVAIFGGGLVPLITATGIGSAPGYARMVMGQVRAVRDAGYVEAARALGHGPARTVVAHILPNALRPLVVTVTMGIGQTIMWASALSFLGLGAAPPAPEWGTMLSMGRDYIVNAWWLTFFPGAAIVLTTLSTTTLGRFLQRRLEGRA
jgi:peptide/nickel transport system permease protein